MSYRPDLKLVIYLYVIGDSQRPRSGGVPGILESLFRPLEGKEHTRACWRHFSAHQFDRMRQHRIASGCEVYGTRHK